MKLHQALFAKRFLGFSTLAADLLFHGSCCSAQTNSWSSPISGNWQDSTWSLGIPPATSQSVMITNAGSITVGIFSTTAADFPATMTVSNLMISAPYGSQNTLLLDDFGTAVPLNISNDCTIETNGSILNLYSGLLVDGELTLSNGSFTQVGGVTIATNESVLFDGGTATLTNATFSFSSLYLLDTNIFVQDGGTVSGQYMQVINSTYDLFDGLFSGEAQIGGFGTGTMYQFGGQLNGGVSVYDGIFYQFGGLVSGGTQVGGFNAENMGTYYLYNGVLTNGGITVNNGAFEQLGGQVTADGIDVYGFFSDYGLFFGTYSLSSGFLTCSSISLGVFGSMSQVHATNCVSGELFVNEAGYTLSGGLLAVSCTTLGPGGFLEPGEFDSTAFFQTGGLHWITNALTCAGNYTLIGGTLIAPAIIVETGGNFSIGPGSAITVSNANCFEFAGGTIQLNNSTQSLAPAILTANSMVNLSSGSNLLKFASSGGQVWTNGATLAVSNWNGSVSGGGTDQLIFGTAADGLVPAQVQQIQFVNPAGFGAGTWPAKILPTGEIVPTTVLPLSESSTGNNVVIQWSGAYVLQAATNLPGPFEDVSGSSPYTNDKTQFPQQFFRLRQ